MKIAQIIYKIDGSGGAEQVALDLSKQLIEGNHQIDIIAVDNDQAYVENKITNQLSELGIRCIFLGRSTSKIGLSTFAKLIRIFNKEKYDIVHSHLLIPDIYVVISKILFHQRFTHIITVHNTVRYHSKYLVNTIFRRSTFVRCGLAIKKLNTIKKEYIVSNAINISKYSPKINKPVHSLKEELRLPYSSKIIISVGNLRPQKNQILGIRMMHHLIEHHKIDDLHYVICGHGPELINLKNEMKNLNLENNIHFLGLRRDIPQLLQQSDVFGNFSKWEGLPLSVIEAFASGIITVISPIQEHLLIGDKMHECHFPKNFTVESFTKVFYTILNRPKTPSKKNIFEHRKKQLDEYSLKRFSNKYLEIYKKYIQ